RSHWFLVALAAGRDTRPADARLLRRARSHLRRSARRPRETSLALALLLATAAERVAALLVELGQDVRRRRVDDVLGRVEQGRDVAPGRLGLGRAGRRAQTAVLPAGVEAAALEARAVVRAPPRGLGRQVEAALPHDLPGRVGAALVVAAV